MKAIRRLPIALSLVLAGACVDDPDAVDDLGVDEAELNGHPALRYTGNPVTIPVCFEAHGAGATLLDGTTVSVATVRSWIQAAVESQWSRYARVNFTQWDNCSAGEAGIHVTLMRTGGSFGGFGPTMPFVFTNAFFDDRTDLCRANAAGLQRCVESFALRAFGNSLGFGAQEARSDYFQTNPHPSCAKLATPSGQQNLGALDLSSIMSNCGQPNDQPATFKTALSSSDIAAVQAVYGRRVSGQLVAPRGADMVSNNISPDARTFLWEGDEAPGQRWTYNWSLQGFAVTTGGTTACLDTFPGAFDGQQLVSAFCFFDSFERFRFDDVSLRGFGGLCLQTPGTFANGTQVQVGNCIDGGHQRWAIDASSRIQLIGTNKCLTWDPDIGDAAFVWDCGDATFSARQTYGMAADGRLQYNGNLCLDALGPSDTDFFNGVGRPVSGGRVFTYFCGFDHNLTQRWNISGRIGHGSGLCMDHNGANTNGAPVNLRTCNGSENQRWDYYWR